MASLVFFLFCSLIVRERPISLFFFSIVQKNVISPVLNFIVHFQFISFFSLLNDRSVESFSKETLILSKTFGNRNILSFGYKKIVFIWTISNPLVFKFDFKNQWSFSFLWTLLVVRPSFVFSWRHRSRFGSVMPISS